MECTVCGTEINPNQVKAETNYQGRTYQFCSNECKQQFDANPQQYTRRTA